MILWRKLKESTCLEHFMNEYFIKFLRKHSRNQKHEQITKSDFKISEKRLRLKGLYFFVNENFNFLIMIPKRLNMLIVSFSVLSYLNSWKRYTIFFFLLHILFWVSNWNSTGMLNSNWYLINIVCYLLLMWIKAKSFLD